MKRKTNVFTTAKTLIIFAVFLNVHLFAQPTIQWQKCLGGTSQDYGYYVRQTTDSGYIVAGFTSSNNVDVSGNHGNFDFWVTKLDPNGVMQAQKCLGGTSAESAYLIQQTFDGGYIVAGYTQSVNGDVSGSHGSWDAWIIKLDASLIIQWQKCLGGTGIEIAYAIQQTSDSGYVVTGYTSSNNGQVTGNHGFQDCWTVKMDSGGNIQWQKCMGGTSTDMGYSIRQTTDGGYIIAGYTISNNGDVAGNHGNDDLWVIKIDATGSIQWQKCLGGTGSERGYSIQQTTDGGYIIGGETTSNNGDVIGNHGADDAWIIKLNSTGTIQWQKCLGGVNDDWAYEIQQTSDGGYIIAGNALSNNGNVIGNHGSLDFWILKIDSLGNIQWQKCLGGTSDEIAHSAQQTFDGGYIVAGFTQSTNGDITNNNGGGGDVWVVKLNPVSSPLPIELLSFDAIPRQKTISTNWSTASQVNNDYFIVERSENGEAWESIGKINGCGSCSTIMEYELNDNFPFSGLSYYRLKQVDYNGQFSYSNIVPVRLQKDDSEISIGYDSINNSCNIYGLSTEMNIEVYDLRGALMLKKVSNSYSENLDISNYPKGCFLIRVFSEKTNFIAKIIK